MSLRLDVYNPANTTFIGSLSRDQGGRINPRLGTTGTLTFDVSNKATADLALLQDRRVIRIHDTDLATDLPEAFFVDERPDTRQDGREPDAKDQTTVTTFVCPSLDAWAGTSSKGGIVLYPRHGFTGRKRDPRGFGWQALDHDKTGWIAATDLGRQDNPDVTSMSGFPAGWLHPSARWIWSAALVDGVHDAATSYFWATLNHTGLVRVSFTANTEGILWVDETIELRTNPDDRFAFKEFTYIDLELDGDTGFGIKATNRGGPAGVICSVIALDEDGEPTGDPLLVTDDSWVALHDPATVPGVAPGYLADIILSEALDRANAAGEHGPATYLSWSFTAALDSSGAAWDKEVSHQWPVGSKGGWMFDQLTQWAADWWVDETGELQLVNLRGSDLTATVTLHTFKDVSFDGEGMVATSLLYLSADDMDEHTVSSELGRWEDAVTFGTSDEIGALEEIVGSLLDELSAERDTATLTLSSASPQPGADFWLGDVVTYPGRGGSATGRVTELVATIDDRTDRVSWQVTLDLEDGEFNRTRARRLRDQLRETFDQTAGGRARLSHPKAGPSVGVPGGGKKGGGDGGFPATITVETFGQEIPSGEWTALDWVAATRNNLMSFAGTEIRRPAAGTWHTHDVVVELQGVDFDSVWKGEGFQARLTADGEVVWPQGLERNTSPDRGLPVPVWAKESLPTVALPAGLTTLEVRQDSGEPQTIDRAYMSLSLREPQAASARSISLGPEVIVENPDIFARDLTIVPRSSGADLLLVASGRATLEFGEWFFRAYDAETLLTVATPILDTNQWSPSTSPHRGIEWMEDSPDGNKCFIQGNTGTGGLEGFILAEGSDLEGGTFGTAAYYGFDGAGVSGLGGARDPDNRVFVTLTGGRIYTFNPPHTASESSSGNSFAEYSVGGATLGASYRNGVLYVADGAGGIRRFNDDIEPLSVIDVSEFIDDVTGIHVESPSRWWISSASKGVKLINPGPLP